MALLYGPDSVHELERAAEQRYREASLLAANGEPGGAVYLLGHVAEMLVKAAAFRFVRGGSPHDPIPAAERDAVEKTIRIDLKLHPDYIRLTQGPHNFLGWAHWLVLVSGARYTPALGATLLSHADAVFTHWDPNMRYHELSVTPAMLAVVRPSTDWLRANYPHM